MANQVMDYLLPEFRFLSDKLEGEEEQCYSDYLTMSDTDESMAYMSQPCSPGNTFPVVPASPDSGTASPIVGVPELPVGNVAGDASSVKMEDVGGGTFSDIKPYKDGVRPWDIQESMQIPDNNKTFLDSHWNPELLEMKVKDFNMWLNRADISDGEIDLLRGARRRRKNRMYTKRSRDKRVNSMKANAMKSTNRGSEASHIASDAARHAKASTEKQHRKDLADHFRGKIVTILDVVARSGKFNVDELANLQEVAWK